MKPKRKVSKNLGRTQHRQADKLYTQIRKRIGPFRRCPFYHGKKYPQFSPNEHDTLNPGFLNQKVPIEHYDFAFQKQQNRWGLQAYCKVCYKAYRDARITKSRATWIHADGSSMNDNEIRAWYRMNVGPTMRCSVCMRMLDPRHFVVSRSMEKGLHNECIECQAARANSVREQEWISGGNWESWTRAVRALRKQKRVQCAGWSRAVVVGACQGIGNGKEMHMDHIIPLRAGGIHDRKNLQPLCNACNSRKSDQIDPTTPYHKIASLVGAPYKKAFLQTDSAGTIERKLKNALMRHIGALIKGERYEAAVRAKKREVNGQWDVARAVRKGSEWFARLEKELEV
mgnify:CR=1 FL=1